MPDFLAQSFQIRSMSIFEAGMLICFGISWPFALRKTFKTKNVKGKSKTFLSLVIMGYICGAIFKIQNHLDIVIWLYIINSIMVSIDLVACFVYRNRETSL